MKNNSEIEFKCDFCENHYNSKRSLRNHIRNHKKERTRRGRIRSWICNVCNKAFDKEKLYNSHQAQHSADKDFKCMHCAKVLFSESGIKNHIARVHDKIIRFRCEKCDRGFFDFTCLKRHISSFHEKTRADYECKICGKCLTRRSILNDHIRTVHEKIKQYKCDTCENEYFTSGGLQNHKKSIHEKRKTFVVRYVANCLHQLII